MPEDLQDDPELDRLSRELSTMFPRPGPQGSINSHDLSKGTWLPHISIHDDNQNVTWSPPTYRQPKGMIEDAVLILIRLKKNSADLPFTFTVMRTDTDRRVFVVKSNECIMLHDGNDLFPSDQLITSLRMLL